MRIITTLIALFIYQMSFGQIPALSVQQSEMKQDLEISQLNVSVNVVGNMATTTFDVLFFNPFTRDLEGEFTMPLSDGQEICRYALEINGKLREGVIVEKIKARQTFEAIVRQNIDPGIANMTKGNFFKTRIFPIPAKGSKRVVLAISETLKGDDENLYYSLPIETSKKIGDFKLEVKVIKNRSEEKQILSDFENIKFDNREDAYCLNYQRKDFLATSPLSFTIPRFSKTNHQLFTCEFEGETYFYLVIKTPKLSSVVKEVPQKITIYWDNSFSASRRNMDKELNFLNNYLVSLEGEKEVTFVTFNHKSGPEKRFSIGKDATELTNYIKHLKYDGATCLNKIKLDKHSDEILLFSDAINTIGNDEIETSNIPIYSISSGVGSNYSVLKTLASETNGEFIDLNFTSLEKALEIMQNSDEKYLSCSYNKSEIKEVFPNSPTRVFGHFEIAGILKSETAMLEINYGQQGKITKTQSFEIRKGSNAPISRIWAEKKMEDLEMNYLKNQQEIFQLGVKFNILTQNTAFIVLDRVEDYLQHNIQPPNELKEEYNKLLTNYKKEQEVSPKVVQERNLERMKRLKSWYLNPIKTSSKSKLESEENNEILIINAESSNPPPPPGVVTVLNIVDDDVALEEEIVILDSETDDEKVKIMVFKSYKNFI